ncbi:MAG: protein phosphatase 2C domain-containing protein [Campylobacterota bacterium]|nr:protein phosphatase 2C domain-containing protein [Campylobacterota bacterium]
MKTTQLYIKTDIGNKREQNEDTIYSNNKNLFAISDGMGGEKFGDISSEICAKECERFELYLSSKKPIEALILTVQMANDKILAKREELEAKIGSTFDIVYIEDKIYYAHVGDSRIYHYEAKTSKLNLITTDHNIPGNLYAMGEIKTLEEVRTHPMGNALLNNMGAKKKIQIDTGTIQADENDLILMCSDGFSDSMPHDMIENMIKENYTKKELGDILFENALSPDNDNKDNISLIIVKVNDVDLDVKEDSGIMDKVKSFIKGE